VPSGSETAAEAAEATQGALPSPGSMQFGSISSSIIAQMDQHKQLQRDGTDGDSSSTEPVPTSAQ
jgi:hypothetical protein